jgi:hypothetical protein
MLLGLLSSSSGSAQGYCLGAIRNTLSHVKASQALLQSQNALQQLYDLTFSSTLTVCREALDLLCTACTFEERASSDVYKVLFYSI